MWLGDRRRAGRISARWRFRCLGGDEGGFDDVVYYGSRPETAEALFGKLGPGGC